MVQKKMVKNFVHGIGRHCESSAMRDLFEYYGFPMSEAMAFGLDATMGFGFFDIDEMEPAKGEVPFFIGGKQASITPNSLACRLLGIVLRSQSFTIANKAWQESKMLIDNDIPLILRVDIGYMDFYKHEEEVHFGGHAISLGGYDEEKGVAYIGDTQFEGFQEILIERLKEARSSEHGSKFMLPKNIQFSMERRSDGKHPPLAAGAKLAIQQVCSNMLRPSTRRNGLQGIKLFASVIPNWKDKLQGNTTNPYSGKEISLARLIFELTHGYIETWGTGGAIFRNLYKEFLEELLNHPELKGGPRAWKKEDFNILDECVPIISESAENWTIFAKTLKKADDDYKEECLFHVDLDELHDIVLNIHNREEELFKKLSKIKN